MPAPMAHAGEPARADAAPIVGLGQALAEHEWAAYDITIFPDGRKLPAGQGSVAQGAALYATHCAACHGEGGREGPAARLVGSDGFIGWDDLLRPLRVLKHPLLVQSMGARWAYATTVFDYIRRAMPQHAPKSLDADACYAVTAYLLHRNGLLPADAVLDARSLPRVVMPGAAKTVLGTTAP
ncbi:MAG: c-type cytochrome [Rhodoferax sp.]